MPYFSCVRRWHLPFALAGQRRPPFVLAWQKKILTRIFFKLAILRFAKSRSSVLRISKSMKRLIHKNTKVFSPIDFLACIIPPFQFLTFLSPVATLRSRQNNPRATRANHHPLTPPQNPYSSRSPSVASDGSYSTSGPLSPPHSMTSDGGKLEHFSVVLYVSPA